MKRFKYLLKMLWKNKRFYMKKKKKKKINDSENPNLDKNSNIIKLSENIYEIVYYRNVNKYSPTYCIENGISYLECCNKKWNYKELNNEEVTCLRCYKTYILNNEKKLIKNI